MALEAMLSESLIYCLTEELKNSVLLDSVQSVRQILSAPFPQTLLDHTDKNNDETTITRAAVVAFMCGLIQERLDSLNAAMDLETEKAWIIPLQ